MNLKFLSILLGLILLVGTGTAMTVNFTSTDTSIQIVFDPPRNPDFPALVYFDNEKIETPIHDRLLITGLEPSTSHALVVMYPSGHPVHPSEYYQYTLNTTAPEYTKDETGYYLITYGVIIVILIILALSTIIPMAGYVGALFAFGACISVIKTETDFIILLAYVILLFASVISASRKELNL